LEKVQTGYDSRRTFLVAALVVVGLVMAAAPATHMFCEWFWPTPATINDLPLAGPEW
jgi:hypothetical protein